MKKLLLVILSVMMMFTCSGCKPEEKEIDETPLVEVIKAINPTTVGFYTVGESKDINDYKDARYIIIDPVMTSETEAIEYLRNIMRWNEVNTVNEVKILDAVNSLISTEDEEKKILVINDAFIEALKTNELVNGSLDNISSVYTYEAKTAYDFSLTDKPFQLGVFGSDERAEGIVDESRYDVDMIMTVNPITHQVLLVSTPRDSYVQNPAHDYQYDKLTHLGDDGPENSLKGLSLLYGLDLKLYMITSFPGLISLVDSLGGIDVDNPYTFSTVHGYVNKDKKDYYYFPQGTLHLNGEYALAYARERQTLRNGDIDRCKHAIVLVRALIKRMLAVENLANFDTVMQQIKNCFHTNISMKQMYGLAVMEYLDRPDWEIIEYTIWDDVYELAPTATYSDQGYLNVGYPYQPDVDYVSQEMKKMLNGEVIAQGSLPSGN